MEQTIKGLKFASDLWKRLLNIEKKASKRNPRIKTTSEPFNEEIYKNKRENFLIEKIYHRTMVAKNRDGLHHG